MGGRRQVPPRGAQGPRVHPKGVKKKASQLQGAGSGRSCPWKGLPARPWPPWAAGLFPPAQRRQSRPGKEPRQVRAGLSPPSSPRPEKGFLATGARSRRGHGDSDHAEIETPERKDRNRETHREGETDSETKTQRGRERWRYRDRESERDRQSGRERQSQRQKQTGRHSDT